VVIVQGQLTTYELLTVLVIYISYTNSLICSFYFDTDCCHFISCCCSQRQQRLPKCV